MLVRVVCWLLLVSVIAGCTPPPKLAFRVSETNVALGKSNPVSSIHLRAEYATAQGVEYEFVPATEEVDEDQLAENREFARLTNTVPAFEHAIERAQETLHEAVMRAVPDRFGEGRPVKLNVVVMKYVFDLGNEAWSRATASGAFGIPMGAVPESDRIARLKVRIAMLDPETGDVIAGPDTLEGTYRKFGLVIPDVDEVNDVMVEKVLNQFVERHIAKAGGV